MRTPDAVLQEVWQIKDAAYKRAGSDSQRFVQQLLERSAALRQGLALRAISAEDRCEDQKSIPH